MSIDSTVSEIEQKKALAIQMERAYFPEVIKLLGNIAGNAEFYREDPAGRKYYKEGMQQNLSAIHKIYTEIPFGEFQADVYRPLTRINNELLPEVESAIRRLAILDGKGDDAIPFLYRILCECITQIKNAGREYGNSLNKLVEEIRRHPGDENFKIDAGGKTRRSDLFENTT